MILSPDKGSLFIFCYSIKTIIQTSTVFVCDWSSTKMIVLALFNSYSDQFYKCQTSSAHIFFPPAPLSCLADWGLITLSLIQVRPDITFSALVKKYCHKIALKHRHINIVKIYQCVVDTAYLSISLFQHGLTEGVLVQTERGCSLLKSFQPKSF